MGNRNNRLINEVSPYLQSHAYQNIEWHVWGDSIFEKAKKENKLLFISIGYSSSYWCNKMSFLCFNDDLIVDELNKHYISVIVDKDERPDINAFYLSAIQIINETNGWPVICFALPDGTPIHGGTYFQPQQFYERIVSLYVSYCENTPQFIEAGNDLLNLIKKQNVLEKRDQHTKFLIKDLKLIIEPWKRKFDLTYGGNQSTPKFPLANSIWFLLYSYYYIQDLVLLKHVNTTIKEMMNGAIFDHLNGGFFRYAVDKRWRIPKYEKILLDNSQLIILLLPLYKFMSEISYEKILKDTLAFLDRELCSKEGLYYCGLISNAQEADGNYYLWSAKEVRSLFNSEIEVNIAFDYFGIEEEGPISGRNIPFANMGKEKLAELYELPILEVEKIVDRIEEKMKNYLLGRNKPMVDKKIITSWNASLARAFALIYAAWNDDVYLKKAENIANFIINERIQEDGCLYRMKTESKATEGFLDDYANTIDLFLLLYDLKLDDSCLDIALKLTKYTIDHFLDTQSGMFFLSSDQHDSPLRLMDFIDRSYASSNSVMSFMLSLLTYITGDPVYWELADQMLSNIKSEASGSGPYIAYWGRVILLHTFIPIIPYTDDEYATELSKEMRKWQRPNVVFGNLVPRLKTKLSGYSSTSRCYYYYIDPAKGKEGIEEFKDFAIRHKLDKI